jgi:hypothetical protein
MGELTIPDEGLTTEAVLEVITSGNPTGFTFKISDPAETAKRIAERDLNAQTLDELLGGSGDATSGRDYLNKPFCLTDVEWQPSTIAGEGLPFYAVLHIVTLDGEAKVLTTGALSVVRKLAVIKKNGWTPAWLKIVKGSKTEAGYEPLDLVKAPQNEIPFAG